MLNAYPKIVPENRLVMTAKKTAIPTNKSKSWLNPKARKSMGKRSVGK